MIARSFLALLAALCMVAAGCSGGDDTSDIPSPTPDAFDHSLLSAIALQEDEIDGLPIATAGFAADEKGVIYTIMYGDDALRIQSTIARKPDDIAREEYLSQLRTAATAFVENEQNYQLEGADLAFAYEGRKLNTTTAAVVAMRGDFVQYVAISANDAANFPTVLDAVALRRYAELTNDRVQQAIEDPGSLTPPATAPTFAGN